MLRKFKISIDGKEYQVEMEEIGGVQQPAAPAVSPVATPAEPAVSEPVVEPKVETTTSVAAGDDAIKSPMPGTILKLLVNVGDNVTENQPIMILEAMKMENSIVAPKSGKVTGIHVAQGEVVNPGEALITIS